MREKTVNVLQGDFYSTAFCIRDVKAFQTHPKITEMRRHMEFFEGDAETTIAALGTLLREIRWARR